MRQFAGVHAVLYALFDEDGALDRAAMARQVELMIEAGVSGITVLGLATEVAKLTEGERRDAIAWAAEDVAGRVPLSVTVFGNSVPEQTALVRAAEGVGADWLILQPPMIGSYGAAEFIRFYGRVAATTDLPVAIQNAPQLMGRGLMPEDIADLVRQHPNITHLKGEMPVVDIARAIEMTQGRLTVLNGQGGLEILDNLRAGCAGFILAPDIADYGVAICDAWAAGDEARAGALYAKALPGIVFLMRSVEHLVVYGKRVMGHRAGLAVHDRAPSAPVHLFGLDAVERYAEKLGHYDGQGPRVARLSDHTP